jgi:hypothetical protein
MTSDPLDAQPGAKALTPFEILDKLAHGVQKGLSLRWSELAPVSPK